MLKTTKKTKTLLPHENGRPLSWSAISSFEYSPEQWYDRYVLNKKEPPSKEMVFGKEIGERLAFEPKFLPQVPRLPIFEHRLLTSWDGIPLVGYVDSLSRDYRDLLEYKTSKTHWTLPKVNRHCQLDMYALMIYQMYKIRPETMLMRLVSLETEEVMLSMKDKDGTMKLVEPVVPLIFTTKRTMTDILKFGARIKQTVKDMRKYADKQ